MQQWTANLDLTERQANLTSGIPDPGNSKGLIRLTPRSSANRKGTVVDDNAIDVFHGISASDWIFTFTKDSVV